MQGLGFEPRTPKKKNGLKTKFWKDYLVSYNRIFAIILFGGHDGIIREILCRSVLLTLELIKTSQILFCYICYRIQNHPLAINTPIYNPNNLEVWLGILRKTWNFPFETCYLLWSCILYPNRITGLIPFFGLKMYCFLLNSFNISRVG